MPGDLDNLPTFQPWPESYTHEEMTALFAALTIKPRAVTPGKMAAVAQNKILGRSATGSGDVEQLDCNAHGFDLLANAGEHGATVVKTATAKGAELAACATTADMRNMLELVGTSSAQESDRAASLGVYKGATVTTATTQVRFDTAGAPSVTLNAGSWLVFGTVGVRCYANSGSVDFSARFYNATDAAEFGGSAGGRVSSSSGTGSEDGYTLTVIGAITITSGNKTIIFQGDFAHSYYPGTGSVSMGAKAAGLPSGHIVAIRISS